MKISDRFREIMAERGMRQEQLGDLIGQKRQAVNRFLAKGSDPKWSVIETFISAIEMSIPQFFEAKIPAVYADQEHADLHDKLQEILESDDQSKIECVKTAIETLHGAILQSRWKRAASPQERRHRAG